MSFSKIKQVIVSAIGCKLCRHNELVQIKSDLKASYLILIRVDRNITIEIGKLGKVEFTSGYYVYSGNAYGTGGVSKRLKRHFNKKKSCRWHLDYLTTHEYVELIGFACTTYYNECEIITELCKTELFFHFILGFGSSDCIKCDSHLLMFKA